MNDEFSAIDLRRIDLNLLVVFAVLVRERSVRRAAAKLHLGAPAVSMALGRLRELFGDELLVRSGGAMVPTPRGLALDERLSPALQQLRDGVFAQRAFDPARVERTIRFASPDDLEMALLPRLLAALQRDAPGLTLIVRAADFRTVPGLLDTGDADVALTAVPAPLDRRHRREVLYREGFVAVFDRKQFDAKAPLTLERYVSVPHLLFSATGGLRGAVDERLAELGARRRVGISVARFSTMPFLLARAPSIANMPRVAAHYYAKAFRLSASPLPFESPTFDVALAWHARLEADPAIAWFRARVRALVLSLHARANAAPR